MSPPAHSELPPYDVLNFFYDDEDNCALTALINNVRFHVIADTSKVRHGTIGQDYVKLLQAVKNANVEDEALLTSSDSGIDVQGPGDEKSERIEHDAERTIQDWMLEPLSNDFEKYAPEANASVELTLEDWYNVPTYFYNLEVENKQLRAIELEPNGDLERRMSKLLPQIGVPKYVRDLDVPTYHAQDLIVLEGSNSPAPYHPARVRVGKNGNVFFLKLVDTSQPGPTKREISMLHRIAQKGLHDRIRCPQLEGLVVAGDDRSKIMGFLQTDIRNPVPLTMKLDTEVPQQLRDQWAEEVERMKEALHEHDVIWGDAKADNFMVDENDDLWIIDFGGSYTEGWVDEEIKETVEGDDMGVEKIANALHDPVANTWDPDTKKSFGGISEDGSGSKKRKAEDVGGLDNLQKRRRQNQTDDEATYCYCDRPSSGQMVACDAEDCEREWFHFDCVGIATPPKDGEM